MKMKSTNSITVIIIIITTKMIIIITEIIMILVLVYYYANIELPKFSTIFFAYLLIFAAIFASRFSKLQIP